MIQIQPITIELPTPILHQLQEISATTQQSIEQVIIQRLLGTIPAPVSQATQISPANLHLITNLIRLALSLSPEECQTLDQQIQSADPQLATQLTRLAIPSTPVDLLDDDSIRQAVAIGLEALAAGQYEDYDEIGLQNLFEDIKRNGRLQRGIEV
jgi:hypothetical protein